MSGKTIKNYDDLQFDAVIAYVNTHFTDPNISIDLLRERFDISPYIIGCCFKDFTSKNFLEYVIDLRITRAAELLVQGECDIREIASQVGYPNPSYFTRTFKKRFGMTPSEYRTQYFTKKKE